jgi:hypothetical protein
MLLRERKDKPETRRKYLPRIHVAKQRIYMYVNTKVIPVDTIPETRGRLMGKRIREEEFKCAMFNTL